MQIDQATRDFINSFQSKIKTESVRADIFAENLGPITRMKILVKKYGYEWLEWSEPETLWQMISQDFGVKDALTNVLYREEKDQILAVKNAILTDGPWNEFDIFENTGQAFCGNSVRFEISQPLSPAQCAWTVHVLNRIRKDSFMPDIEKYIALTFKDRGYVLLPEPLEFVQKTLDGLGNDDKLRDMVSTTWKKIQSQDVAGIELKDAVVDIQIARLYTVREYMNEKRRQDNE